MLAWLSLNMGLSMNLYKTRGDVLFTRRPLVLCLGGYME